MVTAAALSLRLASWMSAARSTERQRFGGDLACNDLGGCGVLYQIGKTGQYTVLHRFAGSAAGDGAYNAIGGLELGSGR